MNAELAGVEAYNRLDQKDVTAWLDLRNKAAHGHYDQYTAEQVAKSDPISLDIVWTTMTATKEAGHARQAA